MVEFVYPKRAHQSKAFISKMFYKTLVLLFQVRDHVYALNVRAGQKWLEAIPRKKIGNLEGKCHLDKKCLKAVTKDKSDS